MSASSPPAPAPRPGRHAAPEPVSVEVMEAEIERDRRSERRLVWYTLIALLVVAILVTVRLIIL